MDGGDFIYIVIAVVLAVLNAVSNKNKKKREAAAKSASKPESEPLNEVLLAQIAAELRKEEALLDETEFEGEEFDEFDQLDEEERTLHERYNARNSSSQTERVSGVEQPPQVEEEAPAAAMAAPDERPLDVPENARFEPIERQVSELDVAIADEDFTQRSMREAFEQDSEMSDLIFHHEEVLLEEAQRGELLDDFDPVKAVVYSEIMKAKYL